MLSLTGFTPFFKRRYQEIEKREPDDNMTLTREKIQDRLFEIFEQNFEIENPKPDVDLREEYDFDSIDAIELLVEIENMLGCALTQEEKKQAMDIRSIDQICDYIEEMAKKRE